MVISIKYSELYSNSYCKVKLFFPYSQCFLIFFEFHKDYYENANMPIKINIYSNRHSHFSYLIDLSLTQWQTIAYRKIKCLVAKKISFIILTLCKWKMVCSIHAKVLVVVGYTKRNCSIKMI